MSGAGCKCDSGSTEGEAILKAIDETRWYLEEVGGVAFDQVIIAFGYLANKVEKHLGLVDAR